jgi:hypothetical protein
LPGKPAFAYYICTGIDLTPDKDMAPKPTTFLEVSSIVLMASITCRLAVYKRQQE